MKIIGIQTKNGKKEEKQIFFSDEVFQLLAQRNDTTERKFHEKIAYTLITHHYNQFPYFIYRIGRVEESVYRLIILTTDRMISYLTLHLSNKLPNCFEIIQPTFDTSNVDTTQTDPEAFTFNLHEFNPFFDSIPSYFKMESPENAPTLNILENYEERLVNEQKNNFINGKIFIYFSPGKAPSFESPNINYTFSEAVKIFPCLSRFSESLRAFKICETKADMLNKEIIDYLNDQKKEANSLRKYIGTIVKEIDTRELLSKIKMKKKIQQQIVDQLQTELPSKFSEYIKRTARLFHLKSCIGWALLNGIAKYIEHIQNGTQSQNKTACERMKIINSFNLHLEGYIQIKDDGSIEAEDVFKNLANKNLTEIQQFINELLQKCDTSPLLINSNKQKFIIEEINAVAKNNKDRRQPSLLSIHALVNPPFEAQRKGIAHHVPCFNWAKEIFEDEEKINAIKTEIEKLITPNPLDFTCDMKSLDIENQLITSLRKNFNFFKDKVALHKQLLIFDEDVKKKLRRASNLSATANKLTCVRIEKAKQINAFLTTHQTFPLTSTIFLIKNASTSDSIVFINNQMDELNKAYKTMENVNSTIRKGLKEKTLKKTKLLVEELNCLNKDLSNACDTINNATLSLKNFINLLDDDWLAIERFNNQNELDILKKKQDCDKKAVEEQFALQTQAQLTSQAVAFNSPASISPHTIASTSPRQTLTPMLPTDDLSKTEQISAIESVKDHPPILKFPNSNSSRSLKFTHDKSNFFMRHWQEIFFGLFFATLAIVGVFTSGALPIIVAFMTTIVSLSPAAAASTGLSLASLTAGTLGTSFAALIKRPFLQSESNQNNISHFFRCNKKKLLIGAAIGLLVVSLAVASLFTLGIACAALTAVGGALATSVNCFGGAYLSTCTAGIFGSAIISVTFVAMSTTLTAALSSLFTKIKARTHHKATAACQNTDEEKISSRPSENTQISSNKAIEKIEKNETFHSSDAHIKRLLPQNMALEQKNLNATFVSSTSEIDLAKEIKNHTKPDSRLSLEKAEASITHTTNCLKPKSP